MVVCYPQTEGHPSSGEGVLPYWEAEAHPCVVVGVPDASEGAVPLVGQVQEVPCRVEVARDEVGVARDEEVVARDALVVPSLVHLVAENDLEVHQMDLVVHLSEGALSYHEDGGPSYRVGPSEEEALSYPSYPVEGPSWEVALYCPVGAGPSYHVEALACVVVEVRDVEEGLSWAEGRESCAGGRPCVAVDA